MTCRIGILHGFVDPSFEVVVAVDFCQIVPEIRGNHCSEDREGEVLAILREVVEVPIVGSVFAFVSNQSVEGVL